MQSLDVNQRAKTIQMAQIWTSSGPGKDDHGVIQPEGLKGSEMTAPQRQLLLDVTSSWVNMIDDETAAAKMADVRRNLDNTYFLWSGDTTTSGNAYFRVQGPTVWIGTSPQTLGGPGSATGRRGAPGGGDRGGAAAGAGDPARGGERGRGDLDAGKSQARSHTRTYRLSRFHERLR